MTTSANWLQAFDEDIMPHLNTLSSCLTLSDVQCDNYVRLIAADIDLEQDEPSAKLRMYRGLRLKYEQQLPGIPCAIENLYIDETEPRTPVIAVAIGESVLFYRHLKPYFKYMVPPLPADEFEKEIWRKLSVTKTENYTALLKSLSKLDHTRLTRQSQRLLQLPEESREEFIREHTDLPLLRYTNIVAMSCLQRVSSTSTPPSHLVIVTEIGGIYILEPQGFNVLYESKLSKYEFTPSLIAVQGTYETDFCIVVGTRAGGIYLLRKNTNECQDILNIAVPLTGLVLLPVEQTIVISTMDQRMLCISKKGKQLYSLSLSALVTCMVLVPLQHFGITLICVALEGGLVQFYMQRHLVDAFQVDKTVTAMIHGRMGMEEHVLTLISIEGDVIIKILQRLARFEPHVLPGATNMENVQHKNVDISSLDKPKKNSIFVEQTEREKQHAKSTYGSFQAELWRLRLTAARATVEAINTSESSISGDITHAPVKMSAEVCGAGPSFRLYLNIQNLSSYKMASNLMVLLHADRRHYTIEKSVAKLPSILPGIPLRIDFEVSAILDPLDKLPPVTLTPDCTHIRVMLLKAAQAKPLIAAIIPMPQSEANF